MRGSYSAVEHDAHSIQIPRSIHHFIDIEAGVDNGTGRVMNGIVVHYYSLVWATASHGHKSRQLHQRQEP